MSGSSHADCPSLGATLAPALLRLALAVTFIWAGLGKIVPRMTVDPQQAAVLASMGVSIPAPVNPAAAQPAAGETAPAQPLPETGDSPQPDSTVAPTPAERAVRPDGGSASAGNTAAASATAVVPPATSEEIKVRRMWGLALRIHASANPGNDEAGKPRMKLWPGFLGSGNWPRYFAAAVVIAELGGGILLALGLLTRLGAFLLAGVMLGAIWLDQIGPAMQAGKTVLLVLPAHDAWDVAAWRPLLWQFSLLCSATAVMLLGAGAPSLDRALGWNLRRGDDDEL